MFTSTTKKGDIIMIKIKYLLPISFVCVTIIYMFIYTTFMDIQSINLSKNIINLIKINDSITLVGAMSDKGYIDGLGININYKF